MNHILLVEDNETISNGLKYTLEQENFAVEVAKNAGEAETKIYENSYDLAILDVSLPDGNGYDLCKEIKRSYDLPVIFLTAKDTENDVVRGFNLGADDYVVKPFRNRELISRIKNVLRRYNKDAQSISAGNLKIDLDENRVYKLPSNLKQNDAGIEAKGSNLSQSKSATATEKSEKLEEVELTPLEIKILIYLFQNKGKTVPREKLLDRIWDMAGNIVNDNTLTVYIKRIRRKLGDDDIIKTIKGVGYRVD